MPTPTKEEKENKATEHFMHKNMTDPYFTFQTPEYYELKEGGDLHKAMIDLMTSQETKAKSQYEKYQPEYEAELMKFENKCYQKLVQDCKKIVAKECEDIIRRRHELGMRILEDKDKYIKNKWGSGVFIKRLASDIGVGKSTVYYAIRFAEKFPDLEKFLTHQKLLHGESLSWKYIVHNLLYEPKPKPSVKSKPLKPKSVIISKPPVPNVELEEPEFDLIDEVLRPADKVKNPLRRRILRRLLLEAVLKFDISEQYYLSAWDFVTTQTNKEIADVDFTINFEHDRVVTDIFGYREKGSQEHKAVKASFTDNHIYLNDWLHPPKFS